MNLDQLKTFVDAADSLSFTRSAANLNLSQPAVSQQIKELETRLQVLLFDRRGKGLHLTPAGLHYRPLAVDILSRLKRAEVELSTFRGIEQGTFNVGAVQTPGIYLLPHAIGAYVRVFPGVKISLRVSEGEALMRQLKGGDIDLAIVDDDEACGYLNGWERIPLFEEELVIMVPPQHRWSERGEIDIEEIFEEPFILRQQDAPIRRLHTKRLIEAGHDPERLHARFELNSTEGIKHAVLAGLGVGFGSRFAISTELRTGILGEVRIRGLDLKQMNWLIRPVQRQTPSYQLRFSEMLLGAEWMPDSLRI